MSGISLLALAALALAAGCSTTAPTQDDGDGHIRGTVQSVDMTPTYADGNGIVMISTPDGVTLTVQIPGGLGPPEEGPNECKGDAMTLGFELQPGDDVEVRGEISGSNVYLCQRPGDYFRRAR